MDLACSSESYAKEIDAGQLTLVDWFQLCAQDLGLKAVELEDKHIGAPTPEHLAELREAADRHKLEIVNIAFMNDFGVADDVLRQEELLRTVAWMDISKQLRTRFLRTFAGWPEGDRAVRWPPMIAALRAACGEAELLGVQLVMENHNHRGFVQTGSDVLAIMEAVGSPALGLLLDTGNYLDGLASIERTARLAWHVHAKFTQVLDDGRDARVDQDAAVAALRTVGYKGYVSVEYEGDEPSMTAVPRALAYLRGLVHK